MSYLLLVSTIMENAKVTTRNRMFSYIFDTNEHVERVHAAAKPITFEWARRSLTCEFANKIDLWSILFWRSQILYDRQNCNKLYLWICDNMFNVNIWPVAMFQQFKDIKPISKISKKSRDVFQIKLYLFVSSRKVL